MNPSIYPEGSHLKLTNDINIEDMKKYFKDNSFIRCSRTSCTENRHTINEITILDYDLNSPKVKEYLKGTI